MANHSGTFTGLVPYTGIDVVDI